MLVVECAWRERGCALGCLGQRLWRGLVGAGGRGGGEVRRGAQSGMEAAFSLPVAWFLLFLGTSAVSSAAPPLLPFSMSAKAFALCCSLLGLALGLVVRKWLAS